MEPTGSKGESSEPSARFHVSQEGIRRCKGISQTTKNWRRQKNPNAAVDGQIASLRTSRWLVLCIRGVHPSQLVQDFVHPQCHLLRGCKIYSHRSGWGLGEEK